VSERVVTTGRRDGDWVEVLSGLAAGDVVVRQPQDGLAGPVVGRQPNAVAAAETAASDREQASAKE